MANFSESVTSARRVGAAKRQEEALRLRIAGHSYTEIAERLGYKSRASAYNVVRRALDAINATCTETAMQMRTLETQRLNGVIEEARGILRNPAASAGIHLRALELMVKASESLRRLWGLDAPAAFDVTSGGSALPSVPELVAALREASRVEPEPDGSDD